MSSHFLSTPPPPPLLKKPMSGSCERCAANACAPLPWTSQPFSLMKKVLFSEKKKKKKDHTFPCQKIALSRERERKRRKWRHHCRAKIGDEFTLSLAKNSYFSFLPSHFPFKFASVKLLRDSGSKHRTWQTIDFPATPSFFSSKIEKMNQINTKNYWK